MERPMNRIVLLKSQINDLRVAYGIVAKYFKKCKIYLLNL